MEAAGLAVVGWAAEETGVAGKEGARGWGKEEAACKGRQRRRDCICRFQPRQLRPKLKWLLKQPTVKP